MISPIIPAPCHSFIAFDKTSCRSEEWKNENAEKGAGFSSDGCHSRNEEKETTKKDYAPSIISWSGVPQLDDWLVNPLGCRPGHA